MNRDRRVRREEKRKQTKVLSTEVPGLAALGPGRQRPPAPLALYLHSLDLQLHVVLAGRFPIFPLLPAVPVFPVLHLLPVVEDHGAILRSANDKGHVTERPSRRQIYGETWSASECLHREATARACWGIRFTVYRGSRTALLYSQPPVVDLVPNECSVSVIGLENTLSRRPQLIGTHGAGACALPDRWEKRRQSSESPAIEAAATSYLLWEDFLLSVLHRPHQEVDKATRTLEDCVRKELTGGSGPAPSALDSRLHQLGWYKEPPFLLPGELSAGPSPSGLQLSGDPATSRETAYRVHNHRI